jgi:hypothetical protein
MASRFANCLPKVEPMPDQMEAMLEISLVGRVKKKSVAEPKKENVKLAPGQITKECVEVKGEK